MPTNRTGRAMVRLRRVFAVALAAAGVVVAIAPARAADRAEPVQRHSFFVGVDTSGSFRHAGYEDAMTFPTSSPARVTRSRRSTSVCWNFSLGTLRFG